jgi:hypothetical protein
MTQETLGYVELEWTCKRCGTKNPGSRKTCASCGAAMDTQDQFELPQQQELIAGSDTAAQPGPDVHCPFCGTRNSADAPTCSQCGAILSEAAARPAGQVLGGLQTGPVAEQPCPYCGEPNHPNAARCKKCGGALVKQPLPASPPPPKASGQPSKAILGIGAVALILLCICGIALAALSARTTDASGVVQSLAWERTIEIMEQRPVTHENWENQIPSGADKGTCTRKVRSTQAQSAPGAEKVCGTPYVIDQGTGKGKVVQDCEYNVYDNWCKYTAQEWQVANRAVAQGTDARPRWPELNLRSNQREGEREEKYLVTLVGNNTKYTFSPPTAAEFVQFTPGSRWTFKVNTLGGVSNVQPAK